MTIEQGNGTVIKQVQLTEMERLQLAALICADVDVTHVEFVDFTRPDAS